MAYARHFERSTGRVQPCWTVKLLDIELEEDHVAVGDEVLLALLPDVAAFAGAGPAADADELVPGNGLRFDEAAREVAVDDRRRLRRGVAGVDGPGAGFLFAGGEVGTQAEQVVDRADERADARLGDAVRGEVLRGLLERQLGAETVTASAPWWVATQCRTSATSGFVSAVARSSSATLQA